MTIPSPEPRQEPDHAPGAPGAPPRRRVNRRPLLGPLLLYLLIAVAVMAPFHSSRPVESPGGDLTAHLSGIIEAQSALREGQFPLRVGPTQNDGTRYPIFQFYGNFPYTAAALLSAVAGGNPFWGWKLVNLLALVCGGFFTYLCGLALTRRAMPSLVAGAVFVLAPYMWTDIHARFAYPETVSFGLLPAVMYYSLRAFATRRVLPVLLGGVCWSLLALSHNITYLYGSLFLGLFFLSCLRPTKRSLWRLMRVGFAYALGVVLALWFVVPQFAVLDSLAVRTSSEGTPFWSREYTTIDVLVWPWLRVPPGAQNSTARLGLQVGWPILSSVTLALVGVLIFRRRRREWAWMVGRLALFFALAFFLVWSPGPSGSAGEPYDFWKRLPKILAYVQFTYRILAFVVLFGSLLTAYALAMWFRRGMRFGATLVALLLVGVAAASYFPRHSRLHREALKSLQERPDMGEGGANALYLVSSKAAAELGRFHPDVNLAAPGFGPLSKGWLRPNANFYIPAPDPGGRLLVEGTVPEAFGGPVMLEASLGGRSIPARFLDPGPFRVSLPLPGGLGTGAVELILKTDRSVSPSKVQPPPPGGEPVMLKLDNVAFEYDDRSRYKPLIPAENVRNDERLRLGHPTRYRIATNQPSVLRLPVLFYPRLLRVTDGGRPIPYGNIGRFVALDLPAGAHDLAVSFVGIGWANWVSGIAWVTVVPASAWLLLRRGGRRFAEARRSAGSVLPPQAAAVGFGMVVLGLSLSAAPRILRAITERSLTLTASSYADESATPQMAFDNDLATAWVARGGSPARLEIRPSREGKLKGIVLESRRTALLESWHTVRLALFKGSRKVHEQTYSFPDQARQPTQRIDLPPTMTDRIEMSFSDPVLVGVDGSGPFDAGAVNPGYREIQLQWED